MNSKVRYYREIRVLNFNQSEARKHYFLASDYFYNNNKEPVGGGGGGVSTPCYTYVLLNRFYFLVNF